MTPALPRPLAVVALLCALALAGCGIAPSIPIASHGSPIAGSVHGGQQPVAGAAIQLYAAGTSGYASPARALLSTPVLTGANGSFSLPATFSCQSTDLIYLTATGGNPGVAGTHNNSALALLAGLGPCSGLGAIPYVSVNELTTIATVWSLSPFLSSLTNVGSSSTNQLGLANAFAGLATLMNVSAGTIPGPSMPAGATLPLSEINTLADILGTCVNSVDSPAPAQPSAVCQTLFAATTVHSAVPTDTVQAAINLAQNPTLGLTLGSTVLPAAPYQPTLTAPPSDWTIAINFVGGGLNAPAAIAVDTTGNVFVPNTGNNSLTKLDTTGTPLSGTTGFAPGALSQPTAIAVDTTGTVWIANAGTNSVTLLPNNGAYSVNFTGSGLDLPQSIAIDSIGNVWIANRGSSSVTELAHDGTPLSDADGYLGGDLNLPVAIAIDPRE
jgi:hypothetical protein